MTITETMFGTRPQVLLGGTRLPPGQEPALVEVYVETDLNHPSSCQLHFSDPDGSVLEGIGADFLTPIEVRASAVEELDEQPLFRGEVYGIDFEADEDRPNRLVLRCYDAGFRLKQRRQSRAFLDVTDADVARQLAADAGVTLGRVDNSDIVHTQLTQFDETHWDFLARRARLNGCRLFVTGNELQVVRFPDAGSAPEPGGPGRRNPLQLVAGENLQFLRIGGTIAGAAGEIEARGWNPDEKAAVVATASLAAAGARTTDDPSSLGNRHGTATRIVDVGVLGDEPAVQHVADSWAEMVAGAFVSAEARTIGDARLQAGTAVSIGRTGRFDGKYTITSARHRFDQVDGYHTELSISGVHDRSLYGLTGRDAAPATRGVGNEAARGATGPALGVVTQIQDPDQRGRVRVSMPALAGDLESRWAPVLQIGAGADRGMLWLPEVGDQVLVVFEHGDPDRPVVLGGLWSGVDAPPFDGFADASDDDIDHRGFKTRIGHLLLFDDTAGSEKIRIETADGNLSIVLDQAAGRIVVSSGDLGVATTGNSELEADGNLTIKCGGNLALEAGGRVSIEAGATATVKGAIVELNP